MGNNIKISVLMPVYNTKEEWLRQAIESILDQTLKEIELVIALDCPTDNSEDIVMEYAEKDDRIHVEKNSANMGIDRSLNIAIAAARGNIIARMDDDDIALPKRLETQLNYLQSNGLDLIGSRMEIIDRDGNGTGTIPRTYKQSEINDVLSRFNIIAHPTWMLYKSVYEELGGYRQIDVCGDYDFLLRAKEKGFKIGICDEVLLYRRDNMLGLSETQSLKQFLELRYLMKNQKRLDEMEPAEINKLINDKCSGDKQQKYEEALEEVRQGIGKIRSKRAVAGAVQIFKAFIKSKYALQRYYVIFEERTFLKRYPE